MAAAPRSMATLLLPLWPEVAAAEVHVVRREGDRIVARVESPDGWTHEILVQPGVWGRQRASVEGEDASTDALCAIVERVGDGDVSLAAVVDGTRLEHPQLPTLTAERGTMVWDGAWTKPIQESDPAR